MGDAVQGSGSEAPEEQRHHHKGKSSEKFLNKELILQALNIQPGQTILDAGCGNGYMAKIFAQEVTPSGKVYALDPDAEAIEALRKETQGTNIEALQGGCNAADSDRALVCRPDVSLSSGSRVFQTENERFVRRGATHFKARGGVGDCGN